MVEIWAVYRVDVQDRICIYDRSFETEEDAKSYVACCSGGTFLIEHFYHISPVPEAVMI